MMLTVYLLPVETLDNTDQVVGADLIHNAILEYTDDPDVMKLIMDTTVDETLALADLALLSRPPTQDEIDRFMGMPVQPPPDADTIRARELLGTSPDVITLPGIWELLRILGRRLGY